MRYTGFLAGLSLGVAGLGAYQAMNPQEKTLDANLYMQTSAEYRAICVQTYNLAAERLHQRLGTAKFGEKSPAVILDLDETVLDNAAFQSFLDREGLTYTDALWEKWESQYPKEVRLIPGAKNFIERAEALGVEVVYISNRLEKHKFATIEALRHLGLNVLDINERLRLKADTSDKTVRRAAVAAEHEIIMLLGDNLRDFSEVFVAPKLDYGQSLERIKGIDMRHAAVDKHAYRFGTDFFMFPNPVYGEWQKPLGANPRLNLRPTGMVK